MPRSLTSRARRTFEHNYLLNLIYTRCDLCLDNEIPKKPRNLEEAIYWCRRWNEHVTCKITIRPFITKQTVAWITQNRRLIKIENNLQNNKF